jgi:glutamate 5-kinase
MGTSLGTGGMSTKIIAAELATAAGVTTVILNSEKVTDIFEIVKDGAGLDRSAADVSALETDGPLCTQFLRHQRALKDRKWWIAHGLHAAGTVVVDEGAYKAIGRRESGGRLLPAGVVRVEGPFAAHQAVRLLVRRKKRFPPAPLIAAPDSAAVTPARLSPDLAADFLSGAHLAPDRVRQLAAESAQSSPDTAPQPGTPQIQPALSLSSSVASLDPLARTGPSSPALRALGDRQVASLGALGASALEADSHSTPQAAADDEWEEVEIGKGLTQYNSVAIDRIKGMKRWVVRAMRQILTHTAHISSRSSGTASRSTLSRALRCCERTHARYAVFHRRYDTCHDFIASRESSASEGRRSSCGRCWLGGVT